MPRGAIKVSLDFSTARMSTYRRKGGRVSKYPASVAVLRVVPTVRISWAVKNCGGSVSDSLSSFDF